MSESGRMPPPHPLPAVPWLLSARDRAGLTVRAGQLRDFVTATADLDLTDAGWSLAAAVPAPGPRAAVIATDRDDLLAGLAALQEGRGRAGVLTAVPDAVAKAAFVFTGQGAQRPGMGSGLHSAFPAFADAFDEVCAELDVHLGDPLTAVITGGSAGLLDETMWAQAGLFAVEVALFRLLESWGARPDWLAGHSIGELAAAHVAGVWSLPDACAVVAARGRLMQALPRAGLMIAVQAGEDDVRPVLAEYPGASIAAVNSPHAVVISGATPDVAGAAGQLAVDGFKTRRLQVSHAFHSPLMEPMLAQFAAVTGSVGYRTPVIPLVSTLTGTAVSTEVTDPQYWVRHVREPVRFADAVSTLRSAGVRTFVELGPDSVLSALHPADPQDAGGPAEAWLPAQRRGRDEPRTVIAALAGLHSRGHHVDWAAFYAGTGAGQTELPPDHAATSQRLTTSLNEEMGNLSLMAEEKVMPDKPPLVKCLVWDLDNTLWQGTLLEGDDVKCADEVFEVIKTLDSRGILQSVASKNDYDLAWARLEELGIAEYIVHPRIGWGPKSESVTGIAADLNFAIGTIAFIDDRPNELAEVASRAPEVRCYDAEQILSLPGLPEFSPAEVTVDARRRREMYQASFRRDAERESFAGPDEDFLRSLELVMAIKRADEEDLSRVEELTLRTSQMNATGVHYSDQVLRGLLTDPGHEVLTVTMSDRFGPHGAVGVMLLEYHPSVWHLKLLATSCRVVSFGAGSVILNWLISQADAAGAHLAADFRRTDRNRMMDIAYRFAGFTDETCTCLTELGLDGDRDGIQSLHLVTGPREAPTTMTLTSPDLAADLAATH